MTHLRINLKTLQFHLHTPHSSANGLTIPAFAFPAEAGTGTHLPTPEGWKAELALGGWLVTYQNKCPAPGIDTDALTTTPVQYKCNITALTPTSVQKTKAAPFSKTQCT